LLLVFFVFVFVFLQLFLSPPSSPAPFWLFLVCLSVFMCLLCGRQDWQLLRVGRVSRLFQQSGVLQDKDLQEGRLLGWIRSLEAQGGAG